MMVKVFQSDAGGHFTIKAVMPFLVVFLGLSVFVPALGAQGLRIPGKPVASGEFHDVVGHFYTKVLPPAVEARDAEKLRALIPLDRAHWKLKDEQGKARDHTSQLQHLKDLFSESLDEGEIWDISTTIKKVTMKDATHGAVLWVLVNNWRDADGKRTGRRSRPYVSHWEKTDGQWRIVATEHGKTESGTSER